MIGQNERNVRREGGREREGMRLIKRGRDRGKKKRTTDRHLIGRSRQRKRERDIQTKTVAETMREGKREGKGVSKRESQR